FLGHTVGFGLLGFFRFCGFFLLGILGRKIVTAHFSRVVFGEIKIFSDFFGHRVLSDMNSRFRSMN
ncbi:MAG: hypothetical protein J6Q06_02950, partial [Clostridia bacterium]|nr:hypothetical protein [Clostridia bacterium]